MLEAGSPSDIEVQTWLGEDPLLSSVDFLNFHLVFRLLCSLSYKGTDSINEGSALMTEAPPNVPYKTITFGGVKISTYGFGEHRYSGHCTACIIQLCDELLDYHSTLFPPLSMYRMLVCLGTLTTGTWMHFSQIHWPFSGTFTQISILVDPFFLGINNCYGLQFVSIIIYIYIPFWLSDIVTQKLFIMHIT